MNTRGGGSLLGQCKDYHTMEIYLAADVLGLLALELRRSLAWRSKMEVVMGRTWKEIGESSCALLRLLVMDGEELRRAMEEGIKDRGGLGCGLELLVARRSVRWSGRRRHWGDGNMVVHG